jgi:histidinol-phosphatase
MSTDIHSQQELDVALYCADQAALLAMDYYKSGVQVSEKHDGSPVTEADYAVENLIRKIISDTFSDDSFQGEEFGQQGESERVWVIDPIDGTSRFSRGDPNWRVQIALKIGGILQTAVVTSPAIGRQWWATKEGGAFESAWPRDNTEVQLQVSTTPTIENAILDGVDNIARAKLPAEGTIYHFNSMGWCSGIIRLLRGEIDCFLGEPYQEWDHAPWILLVEEAGGKFTRREGSQGGVYSNEKIHLDVLSELGYPVK